MPERRGRTEATLKVVQLLEIRDCENTLWYGEDDSFEHIA